MFVTISGCVLRRRVDGQQTGLGLRLLFLKSCLLFFPALLQKLINYARTFTQLFGKWPCLQVASLASRWYLHFLLISGGFGAFIVSSRLVVGVFFYRLRQLPIAKYSYTESIPPFLSLNCCASLAPDPVLTGNKSRAVNGAQYSHILLSARAILLFPKLCRIIGAGLDRSMLIRNQCSVNDRDKQIQALLLLH